MALKILLADDSMTAQNMGKKILVEAGYEVIAVSNGAAAVKKIAEQKPDVVVLDVYMPGYTGLEVCERVKSAIETTKTPVLLTVGKMEPFKPEEGARVKADGVIVKPFEASDLLAAVQKLEQRLGSKNPTQAKSIVAPAQPVDETPEYERTLKIKTPVFDEGDASYQSWKTATAEHVQTENLQVAPAPQQPPKYTGPQLVTPTPTEPIDTRGAYVESVHAEPAYSPTARTEKIGVPPVSEEELAAVSGESQALHVPTDLQASPALGMEHLGDLPSVADHSAVGFEHTTEPIERSTNEINPYKIVEGASEESETPKSGVGRFFSKAKSLFGGAAIQDDEEVLKPVEPRRDDESETLPAVSARAEAAPIPPAAPPSHETFVLGSTGSAAVRIEPHSGPSELGQSKAAASDEVSDLHLSSIESWESIVPAPPKLSSTRAGTSAAEPELETAPDASASAHEEPSITGTAPGLLVTSQPSGGDVPAGAAQDSMLVTDINEMSKEFPTRFGVNDAEPVPVGNAADYPELYGTGSGPDAASIEDTQEIDTPADLKGEPEPAEHARDLEAQVAAAMGSSWSQPAQSGAGHAHDAQEPSFSGSGWAAEETHLEEHEIGVSLHQEMQQQSAGSPGVAEQGSSTPAPAPAGDTSEADAQLAAAMAAAMGTEVTPALTEAVHQAFTGDSTIALDKNTAVIAEIVHRVTERMKPELVAEIARELALEIKKEKK